MPQTSPPTQPVGDTGRVLLPDDRVPASAWPPRHLSRLVARVVVPAVALAVVQVGVLTVTAGPTHASAVAPATTPATGMVTAIVTGGGGEDGVTLAQRRLAELGCAPGPADAAVDARTRAGVVRFQAANRMRQSGRLSGATRDRLATAHPVRCDRRPVVASGTGRRVVVSQHQNYVWLVRADGRVVAQGGAVDNPRVLSPGRYRVGSECGRSARIRMNTSYDGVEWLPYFVRFAPCGVGFHRIPLHKGTGEQIHPDWLLGTNLDRSAGCVRLSRSLAHRVWDFAGVGTRVVVR